MTFFKKKLIKEMHDKRIKGEACILRAMIAMRFFARSTTQNQIAAGALANALF
jgi:hypothetical protein